MPTKGENDDQIGHPDVVDRHPLIVHAAHVHNGHAIFRDLPNVTVERVLRAVATDTFPVRAAMNVNPKIKEVHIIAALRYAADVIENLSKVQRLICELQAELAKRKR